MGLTKVVKRDGRIVEFDGDKIIEAVWKAFLSVDNKDRKLAERVGRRAINKVLEKYSDENPPTVEDIQEIVEKTLVEEGLYEVARSYILYRQRRTEIREIKKVIGVLDDMKLTVNAIAVLKNRYLLKDEEDRVIETPKQMMRRVARYIGLVDIFYEEEIYDKEGKQPTKEWKGTPPPIEGLKLTKYELEMIVRLYNRLGRRGYLKKDLTEILKLLQKKWSKIEEVIELFYQVMLQRYFLPNSPTLMNAGAPLGQLSACFVLPVEDSIESIFDALKYTALIHKSGGGTGFTFTHLRPKGDIVKTTKGVASGPVSFMRIFDVATEVIKQGGKRRGANMGILRIDHPDIMEFIHAKSTEGVLTNFNISVAITDDFMKKLEQDGEVELINPRNGEVVNRIKAKNLFDMIVYNAWKSGDPGLIFIDKINEHNPTPQLGEIESTNPCGEQPLLPYESCNLGSINLSLMVKEKNGKNEIDWKKLKETVKIAVHFLDNVIDANNFPLQEIEKRTLLTRKIGLGVMGWAELLFKLEIPYDSEEAEKLAGEIMEFINYHSKEKSIELAKRRGSFSAFKGSIYDSEEVRFPFESKDIELRLNWDKLRDKVRKYGIRNATTTTIAPTGTISIIAGTTSGIEPAFAISYVRNVMGGTRLFEINSVFKEKMKRRGIYSEELATKIARTGSIRSLEEVPEEYKRIFVTALEISPEWHVRMQAAFQKYTDNATSKTVNLQEYATPEDVRQVFLLAYKLGCKGITIYRYGSKSEQVLYVGRKEMDTESNEDPIESEFVVLDSMDSGGCGKESCKL